MNPALMKDQEITAMGLSSNAAYLTVCTRERQLVVYSTIVRKVILREKTESVVSSVAFSPSQNLLLWASLDGTVSRWTDPIPSEFPGPSDRIKEPKQRNPATSTVDNIGIDDLAHDNFDDDDWIIDDMNGGLKDDRPIFGDRGTREMGKILVLRSENLSSTDQMISAIYFSERYEGTIRIPARFNAHGWAKAVSW